MEHDESFQLTNRSKGLANADVDDLQYGEANGTGHRRQARAFTGIQTLDRYINFLPTLAFGANLLASWESVAASFQAGLLNGGPTSLVYGAILAWIGTTALAASLAEMASITPVVGAQYRWTGLYAPPRIMTPAFWGLLQGWITVFGWTSACATSAFLIGTQIEGLLILNDPTYIPKDWHGTLLAWAILALPVLCNIFARKALAPIEIIGGITHITFLIVYVVVLVVMAPRSTASYVFTETTTGLSGWTNPGVQWNIGLLTAVFPLCGFDGVLHMSDEVKDPSRKVPLSMVLSVVINGFFQLGFVILLLFTLGDPMTALQTPTGYPIIQILYGATNSHAGTTVIMAMLFWNGLVSFFSSLASVSRLTWAFARDKGLPFSDFFGRVSPTKRIPLNALGLVTTVVFLLMLINLGSSTALFAILSLSSIAIMISYVLPIIFFALTRLRGDHIPFGPFRMGRWGLLVNLFAIVYAIFVLIWLPLPPYMPINASNMNYSGPILGAIIIFALVDWFIWGKKRFQIPTDKVESYE